MPASGLLATNFAKSLTAAGAAVVKGPGFTRPTCHLWEDEVWAVYRSLGGIQEESAFTPRPGKWDFRVDGVFVELDEHLHVNRYRAIALQSRAYQSLSGFPHALYLGWCVTREKECLRAGSHGGKWTNPSCEKQFDTAGPSGVLHHDPTIKNGSPRWKQRALYDFCKDVSVLCSGGAISRVSIWEEIELGGRIRTAHDWLKDNYHLKLGDALLDLVRKRRFGARGGV